MSRPSPTIFDQDPANGAGETGGDATACEADPPKSELCAVLSNDRLNVSSADPDVFLQEVQCRIVGEKLVVGVEGPETPDCESLANLMADLLACLKATGAVSKLQKIDLVAHSTGKEAYLRLGTSIIAPAHELNDLARCLCEPVTRLGITEVRLLGCGTASTLKGREAMADLEKQLPAAVKVKGTLIPIDSGFFNTDGFDDGRFGKFIASSNAAGGQNTLWGVDPSIPYAGKERLPPDSPLRIASNNPDAQNLLKLIDFDFYKIVPGLLTDPIANITIPTAGGGNAAGETVNFDVLFDCDSVRYPSGEILRITDPIAFASRYSNFQNLQTQ